MKAYFILVPGKIKSHKQTQNTGRVKGCRNIFSQQKNSHYYFLLHRAKIKTELTKKEIKKRIIGTSDFLVVYV